jgi:hypothetical protein
MTSPSTVYSYLTDSRIGRSPFDIRELLHSPNWVVIILLAALSNLLPGGRANTERQCRSFSAVAAPPQDVHGCSPKP